MQCFPFLFKHEIFFTVYHFLTSPGACVPAGLEEICHDKTQGFETKTHKQNYWTAIFQIQIQIFVESSEALESGTILKKFLEEKIELGCFHSQIGKVGRRGWLDRSHSHPQSDCGGPYCSSPQPFWHQRLISWKIVFPLIGDWWSQVAMCVVEKVCEYGWNLYLSMAQGLGTPLIAHGKPRFLSSSQLLLCGGNVDQAIKGFLRGHENLYVLSRQLHSFNFFISSV